MFTDRVNTSVSALSGISGSFECITNIQTCKSLHHLHRIDNFRKQIHQSCWSELAFETHYSPLPCWMIKDSPCLQHPTHHNLVQDERTPSSHHQACTRVRTEQACEMKQWMMVIKLWYHIYIYNGRQDDWGPMLTRLWTNILISNVGSN